MKRTTFHLVLIAVIGLLAYLNTISSPFVFDDRLMIKDNHAIRDISNFLDPSRASDIMQMRRSVGLLTFALNYKMHGLDVRGYHIVNIVIHILNAFLVYFLLLLTFRTPRVKWHGRDNAHTAYVLSLFASLLFVSHPIQTQAVTYIVQRFTSLATFFYLLSLVLFVRWRLMKHESEERTDVTTVRSWRQSIPYLFSIIFALCAMSTKEIAFTLPIAIVLYDLTFFRSDIRRRALYVAPYILMMVLIPLRIVHFNESPDGVMSGVGVATKAQTDMSRLDYLFTQFRVLITYIRLIFVPVNQNLDYDYVLYRSFTDPNVFLSFVFLSGLFGCSLYLLFKVRRVNDGPESTVFHRLIAFGILWFFITISVESSIIPIRDVINEHRIYLPSIGSFFALSGFIFLCIDKLRGRLKMPAAGTYAVLAIIILAAAIATYHRNAVWKDDITLWNDVVQKSQRNARAYNNLGTALMDRGLYDNALIHFQTAITLDPSSAQAYSNLGDNYMRQGNCDQAIKYLSVALQLQPDFPHAHSNIGNCYASQGNTDKALEHYKRALRLAPTIAEVHMNIGFLYFSLGELDEAIPHLETAVTLSPENATAHLNLGIAYKAQGLAKKAAEEYEAARRLNTSLFK